MTWKRIKKIAVWTAAVLGGAYVLLVLVRMPFVYWKQETAKEVEKIHGMRLTLDDVMGKQLPPDPGSAADATIEGVDANANGIRDDVELAIFKEYPNSAKTRAVLLQYALALQTQMTLRISNIETVAATVEDLESRSQVCLWTLSSRSNTEKFLGDIEYYENFIRNHQINTDERRNYMAEFRKKLKNFGLSNEGCDLDASVLPN